MRLVLHARNAPSNSKSRFVDGLAGAPAKPGPYRAERVCLAGRGCFAFKRAQRKPVQDPVAGRG